MFDTAFTRLVGCSVPIQQAAMGGVTTPELVLAVSGAGGLGMLSVAGRPPLRIALEAVREAAEGPFGVGFFARGIDEDVLGLIERCAETARVVELFWGTPDPELVDRIHAGGALAFWQSGSREELLAAVDAGCDAIVAQGVEAGGHVRGSLPLLALLDAVLDDVDVPVIATGGIASGRAMAAALAAGAAAVRIGTRFVATTESGAHPEYLAALVAASGEDTVLTTAFELGWPDAPHRVLSSALAAAEATDREVIGTGRDGEETWQVRRFAINPPTRYVDGEVTAMALYCGQGVGAIEAVLPAAEVVARIAADAERLLAH